MQKNWNSLTLRGSKMVQPLWKSLVIPEKLDIEYNLIIVHYDINPKELRTMSQTGICIPTVTAALFITAKRWNNPNVLQQMNG